ncbi:MAG: YqgE/AlgH family protein [Bryobacteraceae bacterium]
MPRRFGIAPRVTAGVLLAAAILFAQSKRPEDLAVGKLLVTPRDAPDPTFAESVILLVHYDHDSAVGLMINRRTTIPLSRALRNLKGAGQRSDPAYIGGPVETDSAMALIRSDTKPNSSAQVLDRIYLVPSRPALEAALAGGKSTADLRVYVGYCGWGPGQLDNEMRLGAWYILEGNAALVFDPNPDTVWSRLIARSESNVALVRPPLRLGGEPARPASSARLLP